MTERLHDPRAGTVLGFLAGVALAVLCDYGASQLVGPSYPTGLSTFVLVVAGAFGGMKLADRLGPRAVRVLGPMAGVLVAALVAVLLGIALVPRAR